MASKQYFDFIGTVWENLPSKDRDRFGEIWQGYEQIFAAVYQKFAEDNLNVSLDDLQPFSTERWLPYSFTEDTFILRPAIYTSSQDISQGVNLSTRYLLRFQVDDGLITEVDVRGANPLSTQLTEIVQKINAAAGFEFARGIIENSLLQFTSSTEGIDSKITFYPTSDPAKNASEFLLGLLNSELPKSVPEYPWCYTLPYSNVHSIPEFTDAVRDENVSTQLAEGVDFTLEPLAICFKEEPPAKLWAKRTLMNQENPWNNFGFLMDIYQKNSTNYLTVLQGLWFAFWTGPKPENLRRSLYLLFGLPTAQETASVTAVSSTQIETTSEDGIVRTFEIPSGLTALVGVGDTVERFQPLVSGIDVFDKINRPGFIRDEIGRAGIARFLTENASRGTGDTDETKALRLLEEHTFLPQISVDAFVRSDIDLGNVKTFLQNIKPLNKTFLFQVIVGVFADELVFSERLGIDVGLDITPNLDSNQTTFAESSTLTNYESIDNDALNLDSDGVLLQEQVQVEVYSFAALIDSFVA